MLMQQNLPWPELKWYSAFYRLQDCNHNIDSQYYQYNIRNNNCDFTGTLIAGLSLPTIPTALAVPVPVQDVAALDIAVGYVL